MTLTAIMAAAPVQRIKLEPIGNSAPASIGPIPAPRSLHTVQAAKASTRAGPGFCMATIGDTIGITSERKITTATALIQSHSNPIPNMAMAAANDSPSNLFSAPQRPAIYPPSGLSTMSAKYSKAITAPAAKGAFSGSACALSTERLVVKNPSKAKPCTKDQRCKGLGHLNFLGDFGQGPTAPAGSCSANKRPSRATAVNRKNTARGPSHCDKKAPPNKPSKGPTATMDWERPLRRLAPAGSAVISA